jgi:hypothetical protein
MIISLKAALLGAALSSYGNLFHVSTALTEKEYFLGSGPGKLDSQVRALLPPVLSSLLSCDASLLNISVTLHIKYVLRLLCSVRFAKDKKLFPAVLGIRPEPHVLGLQDLDPEPLFRGTDPDPNLFLF